MTDYTDKSIRLQVIDRVLELLRAELDAEARWPERIHLFDHDPGLDKHPREYLMLVDIRGPHDETLMSGETDAIVDDEIVLRIIGHASGEGMDGPMARDRVDEFYQALRRVAYAAGYERTLGDFTATDGSKPVWDTFLGRVDGPVSDPAGDKGHWGFLDVDFHVTTREGNA